MLNFNQNLQKHFNIISLTLKVMAIIITYVFIKASLNVNDRKFPDVLLQNRLIFVSS